MTPITAIAALRNANYTDREIGRLVQASPSTIAKIRAGNRNPSYALGVSLIDLAKRKSK